MALNENTPTVRGGSSDDLRRHNLALVLRLVHRSRGLSRSQLTRQTGLNRSTIGAIVGELVERGLVVEGEPDSANRVGRPSPMVTPGSRAVGVAVHPEIDAITVGIVTLGGDVLHRIRFDVDHLPSAEETAAISARLINELRAELEPQQRIVGIGVAVPGLVRTVDGVVRLAPHLGWRDAPLAELLATATGVPVRAANDASLGCLAESVFGVGRGVSELLYVNGGASGIGGGILADGRALGGVAGYAGELGHVFVAANGIRCHCGAIGCLETEVTRASLLALAGLDPAHADDLEAALTGSSSPEVTREARRQLDFLAIALRGAINLLNPELIILGGFLGALVAVDPDYLDALIAEQALRGPRELVSIARTELGRDLLMIGAAEIAFTGILTDPLSF